MARFGIGDALRAAAMLLLVGAVILAFSAALRTVLRPQLLESYRQSFGFTPGSRFGSRLVQAQDANRPLCIIIGNSAAREAFDSDRLDEAVPAYDFVNAGTTGGNNLVFELQAAAIGSNGIKPECTILAMNSWNLFAGGQPKVAGEDYLGLLDWRDVGTLSYRPMASPELLWISLGLAMPLKAQAKQLNRSVRFGIFKLRMAAGHPLPLARYEVFAGELRDEGEFRYEGKPSILLTHWDKLKNQNRQYYDPAIYGGSEERKSMDSTIKNLTSSSKNTYIILLPQSPLLERASQIAMPAFLASIRPFRNNVRLVDCSSMNKLEYFVDEGHLNALGRREVTEALAQYLQDPSSPQTGQCRNVKP